MNGIIEATPRASNKAINKTIINKKNARLRSTLVKRFNILIKVFIIKFTLLLPKIDNEHIERYLHIII